MAKGVESAGETNGVVIGGEAKGIAVANVSCDAVES